MVQSSEVYLVTCSVNWWNNNCLDTCTIAHQSNSWEVGKESGSLGEDSGIMEEFVLVSVRSFLSSFVVKDGIGRR